MRPEGAKTKHYAAQPLLIALSTFRGEYQFAGKDRQELLKQIAFDEPKALRTVNSAVPVDLETIVAKATAKSPEDRYATAADLADDLRRFVMHEPIRARRASLATRARKWMRRHSSLVATSVVAMLLAWAASSVVIWRERVEAVRQRNEARANLMLADRRRAQAEANLSLASEATDDLFVLFGDKWHRPSLQEFSKEAALDRLHRFYQRLAGHSGEAPRARQRRGKAWKRLAFIEKTLGNREEGEANIREALSVFEQLVHEYPDEPAFRMNLASTCNDVAHWSPATPEKEAFLRWAIQTLEELIAQSPLTVRQTAAVPDVHYHGANYTDWDCGCLGQYEHVVADTHFGLADLFLEPAGKLEEAEYHFRQAAQIWQRATDAFPDRAPFHWGLGNTHLHLGRLLETTGRSSEANDHYRRAATEHQRAAELVPEGHVGLARYYAELGRHQEAGRQYRAVVEIFPDDLEAWRKLWRHLAAAIPAADDPSSARKALQVAMTELGSSNPYARASLAEFLLSAEERELRDPPRALELFEAVLSQKFHDADALTRIAWRLLNTSDFDARSLPIAIDLAERAVRKAFTLPMVHGRSRRSRDRALQVAQRAVELEPRDGAMWSTLGVAYYRVGQWKDASDSLLKSMELGDKNSFDLFLLAIVHGQLGNEREAHRYYARALGWMETNAPEDTAVLRIRAEATEALGIRQTEGEKQKATEDK